MIPAWWLGERQKPWLEALLSPAAGMYAIAVFARNLAFDHLYEPRRAPIPVVSVGGITVGGSGKTPAVMEIARMLSGLGKIPAVVSRGYASAADSADAVVVGKDTSAESAGDEAVMIAATLVNVNYQGIPVLSGKDRFSAACRAADLGAQVVVLDDGFQHRRLARDLDIVVLDAGSPLGNGKLLPKGPLRESPKALSRADLVWISGAHRVGEQELEDLDERIRKWMGRETVTIWSEEEIDFLEPLTFVPDMPLRVMTRDDVVGSRVFLAAGIAMPEKFEKDVRLAGMSVCGCKWFKDHKAYTKHDWGQITAQAKAKGAEMVITTRKDAVKIRPSWLNSRKDILVFVANQNLKIVKNREMLLINLKKLFKVSQANMG